METDGQEVWVLEVDWLTTRRRRLLVRFLRIICFVLPGLAAGLPAPAQPVLTEIRPRGAQRGAAVRLIVEGLNLDSEARLVTNMPAAITPLSEGQSAEEGRSYLVEISEDAPFGRYPIRVETPEGLSNLVLFGVGPFPEVEELESETPGAKLSNDSAERAQEVSTPVTVHGRLIGPEQDFYKFQAKTGQRLTFEVDARRSGSAIDPYLEVFDNAGKRLARSGDAPGLGLDARLAVQFPAAGEYSVAVHDERFAQQEADFYRLTIAEYDYADGVFPLGWRRGESVEAEFFGGNLPAPRHTRLDLKGIPPAALETLVSVPDSPTQLPFVVGDEPEIIESAGQQAQQLPEGTVVNGRLQQPREIDQYRLSVAAGQQWAFELRSGELPGSDLYGVLTIADDSGEVIATAGKHQGDPNPYVISTTGQTGSHPFVNLEVPPGVRELTVSVEDLLQRGGPSFSYRLVARRQPPDFLLSLNSPFVNIPLRGSAVVTVTAERRGYDGRIDLLIPDAPADLIVQGGHIGPTSTLGNTRPRFAAGTITLTPKPGAAIRSFDLVVVGRAVLADGSAIERRAKGPGMLVPVEGEGQVAVRADWLGFDLPAMIGPAEPAALEFLTPRKIRLVLGGERHVVRWAFTPREPGVRLAEPIDVPRNAGTARLRVNAENSQPTAGEFVMFAHERTELGPADFNFEATIRDGDRTRIIYSQPLEIEVVDGYSVGSPEVELTLSQGGLGQWAGSLQRDPEFTQPVTVKAENLPLGVRCETVQVPPAQTDYAIPCEADPTAPPGEYEVEIQASSKLSDEETTPYNVQPGSAKLVIEPGAEVAGTSSSLH